jgi:hypothetical protein
MEQDGWIERRPDPQDRRAGRLDLKPAAAPILKRILTIADRGRADSLAELDAAERETLISLLERIHANLLALMPGASDPRTLTERGAIRRRYRNPGGFRMSSSSRRCSRGWPLLWICKRRRSLAHTLAWRARCRL